MTGGDVEAARARLRQEAVGDRLARALNDADVPWGTIVADVEAGTIEVPYEFLAQLLDLNDTMVQAGWARPTRVTPLRPHGYALRPGPHPVNDAEVPVYVRLTAP